MSLRKLPWLTLLLTLIALAIAMVPSWQAALQLERQALVAGEWFRLMSCHWTHWSLGHLVWDVLVFVVLGAMAEREGRAKFWFCVVGSSVAISVAVAWGLPGMTTYRGLSGVDSALYAMLAVLILNSGLAERHWGQIVPSIAMIITLLTKVVFEQRSGTAIFVHAGGMVPVPLAHAVGAAMGLVAGLISWPSRRAVSTPTVLPELQ